MAERFTAVAGQQTLAVDLALLTSYDEWLTALERSSVQTARQHEAHPLALCQPVPGIGTMLRLGLRDEIPDIDRCASVQEGVSYCRRVTCAKESAGKRWGTSGKTIGNGPLQGAFSEAAPWFLRHTAAGQSSLARFEKKPGPGKALTLLAQKLARAVYDLRKRHTALHMETVLHG